MSGSDRPWRLEGFPEHVGPPSGEVQRAYEHWKRRCEISPQDAGKQLDGGERYTATIPGAIHARDDFVEQQLICDYEVHPGAWGPGGQVVYVDCGFIPAEDQPD
jgi:hypothetical protein